ncbi:MAG: energy transducer TonB [Polaromonas sp.]|nr:energy transducer TonB [Polaromonas sp.]
MTAEFPRLDLTGTPLPSRPAASRTLVIAAVVVALHAGLLWALQSGLAMRAAEVFVPVELLAQIIEPPAPMVEPAPPTPERPAPVQTARPAPSGPTPRPLAPVQPQPRPVSQAEPTPQAPVVSPAPPVEAASPALPSPSPSAAPAVAIAAPAAPPAVQLPSSNADYLQNPTPPYPPISKRLGEQGKTTVRVLIGADGQPQRADIAQSSGFDRLDQAALATVMRWRYVPGKRGGVPEAMWFSVPINWVLQ